MRADLRRTRSVRPDITPINAGPVAQWLTILFVKARGQHHRCLRQPLPGVLTAFGVCVKVKPFEHLAEAHAMRFIAQHTTIPVPKVYCAFNHKGKTYIVMSRIKGRMAWRGWHDRPDESKRRVLAQLELLVAQIRALNPPSGLSVAGVNGGPICDRRLPPRLFWGPFATIRDFHEELVNGANLDTDYEHLSPALCDLFTFYRQPSGRSVLTHGDLSSLNVLVKGDEVVGIVNWETAGWLPSYWEYMGARNATRNPFPQKDIGFFLDPKPDAIRAESIRRAYF
ncbi:hypothetical protein HIM_00773 [Hirsutella minnesotensis 3608]|nr:hypothetical protein HIM_00773 [Hirsutella minnesotensis 3608]